MGILGVYQMPGSFCLPFPKGSKDPNTRVPLKGVVGDTYGYMGTI